MTDDRRPSSEYRWARQVSAVLLIVVVVLVVVLDVVVEGYEGESAGAGAAAPDGCRPALGRPTAGPSLMAAYGTDPARYLPPNTSQLATKLSADGIDDCLVCSTHALVNGASLGEATRTPAGHEPSTAALVRTAVRMRNKLDDPNTATYEQQRGPLPASAARRIGW